MEKERIIQLLAAAAVVYPPIQTDANYTPRTEFLRKDLPASYVRNRMLDLTLFPGSYGDPDEINPAAEEVLDICSRADGEVFVDVLLFDGHGLGKTKAIYDIACFRYTIILDASNVRDTKWMLLPDADDMIWMKDAVNNVLIKQEEKPVRLFVNLFCIYSTIYVSNISNLI